MIKRISLGIISLLAIGYTSTVLAKTHHTIATSKHPLETTKKIEKPTSTQPSEPQISIYSAHKEKNNYVIALYADRPGKSLITYDSPTCQANSYGDTVPSSKNKSEIIFTSTEDPKCKITLQKAENNQLKITKETAACNAWHGDFCSFSSLSPLTRIYP